MLKVKGQQGGDLVTYINTPVHKIWKTNSLFQTKRDKSDMSEC